MNSSFEAALAAHAALRPGAWATFTITLGAEPQWVLVTELKPRAMDTLDSEALGNELAELALAAQIRLAAVTFLPPGGLPRRDGSVDRAAAEEGFLAQSLGSVGEWNARKVVAAPTTKSATELNVYAIESWLTERLASIKGLPSDSLDPREPFARFGLNSVDAVKIAGQISSWLERPLSPTIFWTYPTIESLASYLDAWRRDVGIESVAGKESTTKTVANRPVSLSLFYFSADASDPGEEPYRLLLEGARFADKHGLEAVWLPERHFHAFGGLYPNPSVLGAAVAGVTEKIRIRAGSVVLPLHHPVRVAEEWSVVDNLSRGRVDLAFAVGWNPNDFSLAPQNYPERLDYTLKGIETIRQLWRGQKLSLPNANGEPFELQILPKPKQPELNVWLTCTGGIQRFRDAGAIGANVLTALLFQRIEELEPKIAAYREARAAAGFDPNTGRVTLMLHTFVGGSDEEVRRIVRPSFLQYLETSVDLWRTSAEPLADLSPNEKVQLLDYAFERYAHENALFGSPSSCMRLIDRLSGVGVDEIACLVDFGVAPEVVLQHLPGLHHLAEAARRTNVPEFYDAISEYRINDDYREAYLTFGYMPEKVAGFSWLRTFHQPTANPDHTQRALVSQRVLRERLFQHVDPTKVRRVMDFGCGYGSDLYRWAESASGIEAIGYTVSAEQAAIGNQRAQRLHNGSKMLVYQRNSAESEFPGQFELIFGFEVAVYVEDKAKLFANVARHLAPEGTLLLAELVSGTGQIIRHPETSSFIVRPDDWAEILGQQGLALTVCEDVSQPVANFLHDPGFSETLDALLPPTVENDAARRHLTAQTNLGLALADGLIAYVLLVVKRSTLNIEAVVAQNRSALANLFGGPQ